MNTDVSKFVTGSTEPWTVDILVAFAHAIEPPHILELGTFEGRTTRRLAEKADDFGGHVTTVELDYDRVRVAKKHCEGLDNISFFQAHTKSWLQFWGGVPFNFVFIDDDHTAAHVADELRLLKDVLAPGAIVFVHDVDGPFGLDAVVREAGGYCLKLPRIHVAGGLGVIQYP